MNYTEAVEYVLSVPKFTKKNKLENTIELMERLGRPERGMNIIHVAGTNGKGSVCAFLSSILDKADKRVGLFTSPHLVKINERFQVNNVPISDEAFLGAYRQVWTAIEEMQKDGFFHPTYFEILFAVAMVAFKEAGVEYVVLETGLGGRLDATNIVEKPLAVIITSISLDHTEILGDTIAKIAFEKAGIIKEGVPVIYDARNTGGAEVIEKRAKELHAQTFPLYDKMYEILVNTDKSIDFSLNCSYYENVRVTVPYIAPYQVVNSSLAMLAMKVIDTKQEISLSAIVNGIALTTWAGRMETVMPGVILDGAHNAAGVEEFVKTLERVDSGRRIVLLFSAVVEKNYESMIETVCKSAKLDEVIVTEIQGDRIVPANQLKDIFEGYTKAAVTEVPDISEAFVQALEKRQDGLLFCIGSLYLVGEIKGIIEENYE